MKFVTETKHVMKVLEDFLGKNAKYLEIKCEPDLVFDQEYVLNWLKEQEGFTPNTELVYYSDPKWTSVKDEFSRERWGYLGIIKK